MLLSQTNNILLPFYVCRNVSWMLVGNYDTVTTTAVLFCVHLFGFFLMAKMTYFRYRCFLPVLSVEVKILVEWKLYKQFFFH